MKTVAALSAVIALANAHATFQQLWKNGEDLKSTCARLPPSNSPIEDYTSNALQCNVNPAAASGKCAFAAGDTVTVEMHQHNDRECKTEGIGGAHWGPVLAYLGKVEDAAAADGSGEFFKIYENGWKKAPGSTQGDNDFWGTKDLNYNCGKLDFKIPSDIAPGDYLLRAEAIALHAASSSGGAQHYVTCYQLTVTGSGTLEPKGVKFPAAYSKTGPGLGFSIHAPLDSYPMPGPALIASGTSVAPQLLTFGEIKGSPSAGGGSKPASSAAAAPASSAAAVAPKSSSAVVEAAPTPKPIVSSAGPTVPSSTLKTVASSLPAFSLPAGNNTTVAPTKPSSISAPAPSSSGDYCEDYPEDEEPETPEAPAPTTLATSSRPQPTEGTGNASVKEFAQCGGKGYTGATTCASGLSCKEWNPYYSQCIKASDNAGGNQPAPAPAPASAEPTKVAPEATKAASSKPSVTASYPTNPKPQTSSAPSAPGQSAEKTYTLKTFIAWLEENAGSAAAAKMRRMIEAMQ